MEINMKLMNLHCHKIDIFVLYYAKTKKNLYKQKNNKNNVSNYDIKSKMIKFESLDTKTYKEIANNPLLEDLYIIRCSNCDKIYKDYVSKCYISISNYYISEEVSVFCSKSAFSKYYFEDFECFEFTELKDYILIGTKNEINLYICESYNSLEKNISQLNSINEKNENLIKELTNELNKERLKYEEIKKDKENIAEKNK